MGNPIHAAVCAMALCSMLLPLPVIADSRPFPQDPAAWPAQAASHKPWTRWWWLGSAVDRPNLTRELEAFAKAGIGGVEICPIYGTKGEEKRYIDFLSPQWMDMLAHTTREAKRLGIGVDVTTGTGWPFGGPIVNHKMASAGLQSIHARAEGGKPLKMKMPRGDLQTLRAFGGNGKTIDLTGQVKKGQLEWSQVGRLRAGFPSRGAKSQTRRTRWRGQCARSLLGRFPWHLSGYF